MLFKGIIGNTIKHVVNTIEMETKYIYKCCTILYNFLLRNIRSLEYFLPFCW